MAKNREIKKARECLKKANEWQNKQWEDVKKEIDKLILKAGLSLEDFWKEQKQLEVV